VAQFSLVLMKAPLLLAVPNISEGRDESLLAGIATAFVPDSTSETPAGEKIRLLDTHADADHHRSVFTLAGKPRPLGDALVSGAAAAIASIDVVARAKADPAEQGAHPHVGAIDVIPLVYFDERARGAACAEALVVADRLGSELGVPVFLYGELAGGRTRAELRRGGIEGLRVRLAGPAGVAIPGGSGTGDGPDRGETPLRPDFGPPDLHPTAGATLVAAREPLVAFNLQLAPPASLQDAKRIAALIREGGEQGLPGLRAIGVALRSAPNGNEIAQVSMNVERPLELALYEVVRAVERHARVRSAELVGLAPRAAFEGFPPDLEIPGFDPQRHLIENALSDAWR
jgi:glutamate formiminotransferase